MLLLDEPTSALDLGRRIEALELVDELRIERRPHRRERHARPHAGRPVRRAPAPLDRGSDRSRRPTPRGPRRIAAWRKHFGADVHVLSTPDGQLAVVPGRRANRSAWIPALGDFAATVPAQPAETAR